MTVKKSKPTFDLYCLVPQFHCGQDIVKLYQSKADDMLKAMQKRLDGIEYGGDEFTGDPEIEALVEKFYNDSIPPSS